MPNSLTRAEILAAVALRPCHVTGMHTPDHHIPDGEREAYICTLQLADSLRRLLRLLDVSEDELPRELHPDCGWCHEPASQEEYRERQRASHRWANAPIPAGIAAPARDAPVFDLPRTTVLAAVREMTSQGEWVTWSDVGQHLGELRHGGRHLRPLRALIADGTLEEKTLRSTSHVRAKVEGHA